MTKKSGSKDFFEEYAVKEEKDQEEKINFFKRMKMDKKYSAKVQLMGYVIFLGLLVLIINVSSFNSGSSNTGLLDENEKENTSLDASGVLENLSDNYSYDIKLKVVRDSVNVLNEEVVNIVDNVYYLGKSYGNTLEINKEYNNNKELYYRVGDEYYSMVNNIITLTKEEVIYDIIDFRYVEVSEIIKLVNEASLDYVTEYSNGKKEFVYHLKVRDIVGDFLGDDIIEFKMVEENDILLINVDYSSLFKVIYENVLECFLEVKITDINKIEEFNVVVSSDEEDN